MTWSISWVDVLLFLLACLVFLYYQGTKNYGFFKKRGIKYGGQYPFVGNMGPIFIGTKHMNDVLFAGYNKYENERYYGNFFFTFPELVIRDIDLIRDITVKSFDHFTDHFQVPDERDPLHFYSLFTLQGKSWHQMRTTLSPAFTGSKMKAMVPFVTECSEKLITYLDQLWKTSIEEGKEYIDIELKQTLSKISNDIIASCAFGLKTDSLADPDNTFYKMSMALTTIKVKDGMKVIISKIFPFLNKIFNAKLMDQKLEDYYKFMVTDIIKTRNKTGEVRKDMIHLLMLATKGALKSDDDQHHDDVGFATVKEDLESTTSKITWTDNEITAQAVIFLFAGFETLSTMVTFMSYELVRNPEVQVRLTQEVDDYIERTGGMIKYEDIRSLTYMDMVMSETLRRWPAMGNTDRVCVKPFTILAPDKTPEYTIEKGEAVRISIYSIHMDPKHFPEPEKFDPERFSEENKGSIKPFTYLPFGVGPRSCIGNRFAIMEIKVVMFYLLANYEIVPNPKTPYPLEIKPHPFQMLSKTGFWFGLKKRQTKAF